MNPELLLNPPRRLPGWDDIGLFDNRGETIRLVKNKKTGVVMQLTFNGSLRGVAPAVAALVHGAPGDAGFEAYTASFAPASFDAVGRLIRAESGAIRDSARAVLVDGVSQADASRRFGVFPQSLSRTVGAYRKAMELCVVAVQGG